MRVPGQGWFFLEILAPALHGARKWRGTVAIKKLNFTKPNLDALAIPSDGRRDYHYDAKTRGLALCVTSNGSKTFYVVRWVAGKSERIRIGPYPDLPIEVARKKAEEINGQIALGDDPQERRRQLKQDCTFAELFAWYLEHHAKPRKRTWAEDEEKFRNHCGSLAKRKISRITRSDIRLLHTNIGKTAGPYAANRTLALVRCVFNKGIRHEVIRIDANPATGIDRFPEQSRDRRLMASELPAFLKSLDEEPNADVSDFFLMLLCTGARRTNVQMMRWEEVDLVSNIWRIPHTKNGTPQTLPLGPEELEILKRRKVKAKSPWVFPGGSPAGHLGVDADGKAPEFAADFRVFCWSESA
jgi:hypothetical protein